MEFETESWEMTDEAKATAGVPLSVSDDLGRDWGTFTCRYLDTRTIKGAKTIDLTKKRCANKIAKGVELRDLKIIIVEMVLVDWEVKGKGGKVIPFDKETAYRYFAIDAHQHILGAIYDFAVDYTNFAADEEALPEEVAKN